MENRGPAVSRHGIEEQGITGARTVYWNLPPAELYEQAVVRGEAAISADGALICHTGEFTGRSPNDKFVAEEAGTRDSIWWGKVNKPIAVDRFAALQTRVQAHFAGKDLFVFDGYAGADPSHRIRVRVVTETAWQSLFARNMFLHEEDPEVLAGFVPDYVVLDAMTFKADPERDGTRTSTFILVGFNRRTVLIGGTRYAGEIKKSIFTVMNYLLPGQGVFPMHCSANYGRGQERRRALLRPVGHRQDDALGRPRADADRRRRARLGRRRRLQHRGRLLRQGDPALARGRAGHLGGLPPFRHRARERRLRPGDATARPRLRPRTPRTPARATRSPICATATRAAWPATRRTSSS